MNQLYLYMIVGKKPVKRKFVTTHQLQQQQKNKKVFQVDKAGKKNTQMLLMDGTRRSPRLNKVREINDDTDCEKLASARRKLDLQEPPLEDEDMAENELEVR